MIDLTATAFADEEWVKLLSREHCVSEERVIITGNFHRTLKINKVDWENYFADFGGIAFKQGKEIEILPTKVGGSKVEIPEWVKNRLASIPGATYCITERGGQYCFKKLALIERPTTIPGCTVVDSFERDAVRRAYSILTDIQKITYDSVEQALSRMGELRYDPIAPFEEMGGRIGYLARIELLDGPTSTDRDTVRDYVRQLAETQLEDGSWESNTVTTAFNLIRLAETGATLREGPVEKGVSWLLSTSEPLGFPGLFMVSEKLVSQFNAWKEKQERGKSARPHRKTTDSEAQKYLEDRDALSSISAWPCELRLTWTSGIAIEALLRCGLHEEPRVVRAVNTLLKMSGEGNWCGCGYFDSRDRNFVAESTEAVDFDQVPVLTENMPHCLDWFAKARDIARLVCDNHKRYALDVGEGQALLMRPFRSTGECSMVVRKALSFHPKHHGSNFEVNAALLCTWYQGADGAWGDAYRSTALGLLARIRHPLSAFMILRSIPLLIREQGPDGLWQERQIGKCPPLAKAESTFIILRALKEFDFLDALLPRYAVRESGRKRR